MLNIVQVKVFMSMLELTATSQFHVPNVLKLRTVSNCTEQPNEESAMANTWSAFLLKLERTLITYSLKKQINDRKCEISMKSAKFLAGLCWFTFWPKRLRGRQCTPILNVLLERLSLWWSRHNNNQKHRHSFVGLRSLHLRSSAKSRHEVSWQELSL